MNGVQPSMPREAPNGIQAPREPHTRNQSRQKDILLLGPGDAPTPASDAWEIFMEHAEDIMRKYCASDTRETLNPASRDTKSTLESLCGPGADLAFDCMLACLANVSQESPKRLIDAIMLWRQVKSKNPPSSEAQPVAHQDSRIRARSNPSSEQNGFGSPLPAQSQDFPYLTEDKRARACTYVLLRVLAEVFSMPSIDRFGSEVPRPLQDIIFRHQLLPYVKDGSAKAPVLDKSAETYAKWDMTAVVWGHMSRINFQRATELLIPELQTLQTTLGIKTLSEKNLDSLSERHLKLILRGVRFTKLPCKSSNAWLESCNFLNAIAEMFVSVHGSTPKIAYAKFVGQLLLPVVAKASSYLETHAWRQVYQKLYDRLSRLASKAKYFNAAYPALAILNCLAPYELFEVRWRDLLNSLSSKLRERNARAIHLRAVCRMLWIRLRRKKDSDVSGTKMLEEVGRIVFFSGRKYSISAEAPVAESLIELIRIIADADRSLCIRSIVFPLLNTEHLLNRNTIAVTDLDPDKLVLGIRGFTAIMDDVERQTRPYFPASFQDERDIFLLNVPTSTEPQDATSTKSRTALAVERHRRSSRPLKAASFAEKESQQYQTFCQVLNRITRICNNTHGGEAVINQQFSIKDPKTPFMDGPFFRAREESQAEESASYYDLLRTAIRTLPRCPSPEISNIEMVTLLCFGVSHPESDIAEESATALKAIAQQGKAHLVVQRFTVFIFNYDTKYATLSDSGMLGPDFAERTLRLYCQLLEIWHYEIEAKLRGPANAEIVRSADQKVTLDKPSTWQLVDRVEAHGLLFLCSPSHRIRAHAIKVLKAVTSFDSALGSENPRVYTTMELADLRAIKSEQDTWTAYDHTMLDLRIYKREGWRDLLNRIARSADNNDVILWRKLFPHVVRIINEACPVAVVPTRNDVCARLVQMQYVIELLGRKQDGGPISPTDGPNGRTMPHYLLAANNATIEQWRNYLTFACATLNSLRAEPRSHSDSNASSTPNRQLARAAVEKVESVVSSVSNSTVPSLVKTNSSLSHAGSTADASHARTSSKSSSSIHDSLDAENDLLTRVTPLLYVENALVREATSNGLASIHRGLYRPLVESLLAAAARHEEMIDHTGMYCIRHQKPGHSHRRLHSHTFGVEVAQLYSLTSHFLQDPEVIRDSLFVNKISSYMSCLFTVVRETEPSLESWKLRRFYCTILDQVYTICNNSAEAPKPLTFQDRKTVFMTLEEWHVWITESPDSHLERIKTSAVEHQRVQYLPTLRKEMSKAAIALLAAMSSLCAGPVRHTVGKTEYSFQIDRIVAWADGLLKNDADKQHRFGQRAFSNLVLWNPTYNQYFLNRFIDMLFIATKPKAVAGYLDVLRKVGTKTEGIPDVAIWKIIGALLYVLGNPDRDVRMRASRMIRKFDEAHGQGISSLKLRDLDISLSDKTINVYKRAQFEIASTMADTHPDTAAHVFSELSQYFVKDGVKSEQHRNLVTVLLPWLRNIELMVDPADPAAKAPSDASYVVLVNMLQITVRCGKLLHTEVEAMWQTLVTGKKGNLKLIMDFVIDLCLEQRDSQCINCAKQIVVYLATAKVDTAGTTYLQSVIAFLLLHIRPRNMVTEERSIRRANLDPSFSHMASMKDIFPNAASTRLSPGLVCLMLLVDLIVAPMTFESDRLLSLLVCVFVCWDHESEFCREQARELLMHLIHEMVISHLTEETLERNNGAAMDALVEHLRLNSPQVTWSATEGLTYTSHEELPAAMTYIVPLMLTIFEATYPGTIGEWGKTTLSWAVECPVPHLACRSLQMYRCCLQSVTQSNITDVLARLMTTASDENERLNRYSTELLRACQQMASLEPAPSRPLLCQIFWIVCAALGSASEMEYQEALATLEVVLLKLNLHDLTTINELTAARPTEWDWNAQALCGLLYQGLKSDKTYEKSLAVLNQLVKIPSNAIVGDDSRKVFITMANIIPLSRHFSKPRDFPMYSETSKIFAAVAKAQNWPHIAQAMDEYTDSRWNPSADFVGHVAAAVRLTFFPSLGRSILQFLLSMLSNKCAWMRKEILLLIGAILADTDITTIDFQGEHREVLAALKPATRPMFDSPHMAEKRDEEHKADSLIIPALALDAISYCHGMLGKSRYDLYGVSRQSGWAIPNAAQLQQRLRKNLRLLYEKYPLPSNNGVFDLMTPQIGQNMYTEVHMGHRQTRSSQDATVSTLTLTTIDDVHGQLEELDSLFFDETPAQPATNGVHYRVPSQNTWNPNFATPNQSFTSRNSEEDDLSRRRGQHSRAPSRKTPPREPPVMSPSAFAATPRRSRPGMQRSITSPPTSLTHSPPDRSVQIPLASAPSEHEPFSDDDVSAGRTSMGDSSFTGSATIRQSSRSMSTSLRTGVRSLSRRLTGGRRAPVGESPDVPQVPDQWRQQNVPLSSDL